MLQMGLEPSVAIITAVIALVAVSAGVRYAGRELGDRQVPLAGVAAAFIFAAQMVNFPVAVELLVTCSVERWRQCFSALGLACWWFQSS